MDAAAALRHARRRAGLTIRALADAAGTSHSTIAAYEAGRVIPRADTLQRLLRACGHSLGVEVERVAARDPRRGPPDEEFAQVLALVEATGERPRSEHPPWQAPIFRRLP